MSSSFKPAYGAAGFQLSNPSVIDVMSLVGSLQIFIEAGKESESIRERNLQGGVTNNSNLSSSTSTASETDERELNCWIMRPLREKSVLLTFYLESLLMGSRHFVTLAEMGVGAGKGKGEVRYTIITPQEQEGRGAQLSVMFLPEGSGVMERVFQILSEWAIVGDERGPDVIRLAPAPIYNSFEDVRRAADGVIKAMDLVVMERKGREDVIGPPRLIREEVEEDEGEKTEEER